jgi:hypothetical protein
MKGAGDKFLARAGLAVDQYGRVCSRNHLNCSENVVQTVAFADGLAFMCGSIRRKVPYRARDCRHNRILLLRSLEVLTFAIVHPYTVR